ncbi:MAG: hypothetical protein H3Z54_06460 [archaeon]|nr:hypothetical protein [archaeon]
MKRIQSLALLAIMLIAFASMLPLLASAKEEPVYLMVVEWGGRQKVIVNDIPPEDDSMTNSDYRLLPFHWYTTAKYWINTSNKYGFSSSAVVATITASAETWDSETSAFVFSYQGTTRRSAGIRDNYNVVAWGLYYNSRAIAVTYIWYRGSQILETDTRMNTYYKWSLSGVAGKMDVQNIMTHEFGHWVGLNDLYSDADYWLTMYGYSGYGETYKQTLGLGDILGLEAWYRP